MVDSVNLLKQKFELTPTGTGISINGNLLNETHNIPSEKCRFLLAEITVLSE